jgi:hypothetical protein
MSFYRFESDNVGIYEAVNRDCPVDDPKRINKPDGSWLSRVGPQFPGCISFWNEAGLKKYISSGLFYWHSIAVRAPITIRKNETLTSVTYEDEYQAIADKETLNTARTTT